MHKFDYIIVGSGLAGLYAAYKASMKGSVAVITKSFLRESNSFNAQGGIAAVTSNDDNPEIHKSDTLIAGRGLCEDASVDILVNEGPDRIEEIIADGMKFDTENGSLALGLEGGHHKRRILHAGGDATGRWITEFAISKVLERDNIKIFENTLLLDLLVKDGVCYGVRCWSENEELQAESEGSEVMCISVPLALIIFFLCYLECRFLSFVVFLTVSLMLFIMRFRLCVEILDGHYYGLGCGLLLEITLVAIFLVGLCKSNLSLNLSYLNRSLRNRVEWPGKIALQ